MKRLLILLVASAALGACVPRLGVPPVPATAPVVQSVASLPPRAGVPLEEQWWRAFGDPQLDALVAEGLKNAPDIAAAASRVASAQAIAEQTGAADLPGVTADGQAGFTRQSRNLGIPPQFVPAQILSTGRLTLTAQFNLDLWGKQRAAVRAARGDTAAAQLDAAQGRLLVASEVVTAYADVQRLLAALDLAQRTVALRDEATRLTQARFGQGLETQGSVAQAAARTAQARGDLQQLEELRAAALHRLSAAVGAGPDRVLPLPAPRLSPTAFAIPGNAGINLVGRRPDLAAARVRAQAAAERIKVAKADFYPNISLAAVVGLQALRLPLLPEMNSAYGTAGPAFSLPIFDNGRIAGRYRQARADYDQAVANYDRTLIAALREAADAVSSTRFVDTQLEAARETVRQSEEASRVARLRYQAGLSNQLPVITADDTLVAARRALNELEGRRYVVAVQLARALGGGLPSASGNTAGGR